MDDNEIQRIILADGTVLNGSSCGYAEKQLWCYIKGLTFAEVFQIFSNYNKTSTIVFDFGLAHQYTRTIYSGFTDIHLISQKEYTVDTCMYGTNTNIVKEEVTS